MGQQYQGVEFEGSFPSVNTDMIRECERQVNARFPDEYRAFLETVNGGVPTPSELTLAVSSHKVVIDFLYGIKPSRDLNDIVYEQQRIIDRTDGKIPKGFVTIGFDPGSAPYFISTSGHQVGSVYMYDPDGFLDPGKIPKLHLVATSFEEVLRKLCAG